MWFKFTFCFALFSVVAAKSFTNYNKYIIVLKDGSTRGDIKLVMGEIEKQEERGREEMEMEYRDFLFPVVIAILSDETFLKISALPAVDHISKDGPVHMYPITVPDYNTSKWQGLQEDTDRYNLAVLDKPAHECGDNTYNPINYGYDADIYIMDTGINCDHADFKDGDGVSRAHDSGFGSYRSNGGYDCNGHGSHCAGIAAGITSGAAKEANLFSVPVLDCSGSGSYAGIITALNDLGERHEENKNKDDFVGSVASMSLGGPFHSDVNAAVDALVEKGVVVVTASGNDGYDACYSSPGSAVKSINVGASSIPEVGSSGCLNPMESFSNWGTCVDIIAPGRNIMSVSYQSNTEFTQMSGTSMACPLVAGVAAINLKDNPTLTPEQVKAVIIEDSVDDLDRSMQSAPIREVSNSLRVRVLRSPRLG